MSWSTHVKIHKNKGPWLERNYIIAKEQKRDEYGKTLHVIQSLPEKKKKKKCLSQDSFAYNESLQHPTS